jgi:hypothetical protein
MLFYFSQVQIFSSALCYQTRSIYVRPSEWETKFHNDTQQVKL